MKERQERPIHEFDRKGIKKLAHTTVRSHYVLLLFVCLLLMVGGLEYTSTLSVFRSSEEGKEISSIGSGALIRSRATDTLDDLISGTLEKGDEQAKARLEKYKKRKNDDSVFGRRRGVFASAVNSVTSGFIFFQIAQGLKNISHSEGLATLLFALLMFAVYMGIWVFIKQPISAFVRRVFLEARIYRKVPLHHLVWIQSVHRWSRVSLTMTYVTILQVLWWFTIIGGFIKQYSYMMVPFIIAENPDIKPKEAVKLSREMMYGHKMEAFKLDLSFLLWIILSVVTVGFSDLLYGVPYRLAVKSEYYKFIRDCAKADDVPNAERLNDVYLYEHADEELLKETYSDITTAVDYVKDHTVELQSWQKFFIRNFGVWLGSTAEKNEYQKVESMRFQAGKETDSVMGLSYPRRLHPLYDSSNAESRDLEGTVSAFRCYTIWSLIIMFFAFSFVGWVWEVSLHVVTDGVFVNRGTMHGPWLPIYGYGAVYILVFLNRLRKNPVAEFIGAIILSGFVEFMTSWYLEVTKGMRWWDYTGYFLNLNGRICGEGLLIFGLGGMAVVYLIAPLLDAQISKLKNKQVIAVCLILLSAYSVDSIYTKQHPNVGKGITDYTAYKDTGSGGK